MLLFFFGGRGGFGVFFFFFGGGVGVVLGLREGLRGFGLRDV